MPLIPVHLSYIDNSGLKNRRAGWWWLDRWWLNGRDYRGHQRRLLSQDTLRSQNPEEQGSPHD